MADARYVTIDFSWANDSEHQGAEAEIVTSLLRAGWQDVENMPEGPTRTLLPPAHVEFASALAEAQSLVGRALVQESDWPKRQRARRGGLSTKRPARPKGRQERAAVQQQLYRKERHVAIARGLGIEPRYHG